MRRRRIRLAAGAVGLRQDHHLAHDRGLHRSDRGHHRRGRQRCCPRQGLGAAGEARHVDDLPELRDLAQHDGGGERGLRTEAAQAAGGGDQAPLGEVLDVVQMGAPGRSLPRGTVGGQQQRVALARAIVVEPSVLLLDEPLSNLDANLREEMRFEIRRLHDEFRITTVYVTHDQAEAMVTSDRIAVMNKGRIEQVDAPHALYSRPKTRFVAGFIGAHQFHRRARSAASEVVFDRFAIAAARLRGADRPAAGRVSFSLRPQSHRAAPAAAAAAERRERRARASFTQRRLPRRALGLHDAPRGERARAAVTARPHEVFEVDEKVWLELDPGRWRPSSPSEAAPPQQALRRAVPVHRPRAAARPRWPTTSPSRRLPGRPPRSRQRRALLLLTDDGAPPGAPRRAAARSRARPTGRRWKATPTPRPRSSSCARGVVLKDGRTRPGAARRIAEPPGSGRAIRRSASARAIPDRVDRDRDCARDATGRCGA